MQCAGAASITAPVLMIPIKALAGFARRLSLPAAKLSQRAATPHEALHQLIQVSIRRRQLARGVRIVTNSSAALG
jgi:hypothetical protein